MPEQRFQLQISVRVQQLQQDGSSDRWYPIGSQGLEVSDSMQLTAAGFMEVAGILGRFHELSEKLREEKAIHGI